MKKLSLIAIAALFLLPAVAGAQDLSQRDVPDAIVNHFKQTFPKARDVEWEKKGNLYEVEFETGVSKDHEILYNESAKVVRHKEELTAGELPDAVKSQIEKSFAGYRTDDVDKITEEGKTVYIVELKSASNQYEVTFDEKGTIVRRKTD